jgi:NADPH:quinone reductase-like Zn-dependent oxidoreductase
MKQVYFEQTGGPQVLKYGDMPDPTAGPGEVVVDVHAASVNAADWKVRSGDGYKVAKFPSGIGRDFSGRVASLGPGVTEFKIGDPVFGVCDVGFEGAYAEKVAIKAAIIARKPEKLSHKDAAAMALTGLTALVAVEDTLALKPGEAILVQGGAGGVASLAIQIAKHIGARVITTASPSNHAYVKAMGADQVIDYNKEDFTKVLANIDAVFDTVGGSVAERSFSVLKPGGRAAFIASGPMAPKPSRDDVRSLRPNVKRDRQHLERILSLWNEGAIRVLEIKLFKLAEAAAAHELSEGRHLRGKLVFMVR